MMLSVSIFQNRLAVLYSDDGGESLNEICLLWSIWKENHSSNISISFLLTPEAEKFHILLELKVINWVG